MTGSTLNLTPDGFSIEPLGPFSLDAAVQFSYGWEAASIGEGDAEGVLRLAFALDDFSGHASVAVTQRGSTVYGEVSGTDDVGIAATQAIRILSLDIDATGYPEIGERDPVVGELQQTRPGLRPVNFHSPYEAAAWSIISARTPHANARRLRNELGTQYGRAFDTSGGQLHAFPLPQDVLQIDAPPEGLTDEKLRRLKDVAQAALDGLLDTETLRGMDAADADAQLQTIRGIGPFYSQLILVRATGAVDRAVSTEKRLQARIADLYGADADPDEVMDKWRPFRTWTSTLLRSTA